MHCEKVHGCFNKSQKVGSPEKLGTMVEEFAREGAQKVRVGEGGRTVRKDRGLESRKNVTRIRREFGRPEHCTKGGGGLQGQTLQKVRAPGNCY